MESFCKICNIEHAFNCKCNECFIDVNDICPCPDFISDDSDMEENNFGMLCNNCMSYQYINFDLINNTNYIKNLNKSARLIQKKFLIYKNKKKNFNFNNFNILLIFIISIYIFKRK
tara:strand:+ start:47 stop:394 length:348 start_codon:yes stop_codon:yes gene_type:complete